MWRKDFTLPKPDLTKTPKFNLAPANSVLYCLENKGRAKLNFVKRTNHTYKARKGKRSNKHLKKMFEYIKADGTVMNSPTAIDPATMTALGLKPATTGEDIGAKVFAKAKAAGRMPVGLTAEEAASLDKFKQDTFGSYITDLPIGTTCTAKVLPLKDGRFIRGNATSNGQSAKAFFACESVEQVENGKTTKFNVNARIGRVPFTREQYASIDKDTLFACEVVSIDSNDETSAKVWNVTAVI